MKSFAAAFRLVVRPVRLLALLAAVASALAYRALQIGAILVSTAGAAFLPCTNVDMTHHPVLEPILLPTLTSPTVENPAPTLHRSANLAA